MKLVPILAATALSLGSCYAPPAVAVTPPSNYATVDSFDPYLDPWGAWVNVPGYGRTWQPAPQVVGNDFYPYGTGGRWVYTSAGWFFESEYPFGWAVFHYGRWMRHAEFGWLWIPGSEWGPSWVSWRMGGPYVGWAPLGPRGNLDFQPYDWCFVPVDRFTVRNVRGYSAGAYEFHNAVAVTAPVRSSRLAGPPPQYVSRATGTRIEPVPVERLRGVSPVPPPPPSSGRTATGPMRVDPPSPPMGWRQAPDGFQQQPRGMSAPPPPNSYRAAPQPGFEAPRPGASTMNPPPPARFKESPAAPPMSAPPSPPARFKESMPASAPTMSAPSKPSPAPTMSAPPPPARINTAPPPPPSGGTRAPPPPPRR